MTPKQRQLKGKQGEREVAALLNPIIHEVRREFGQSEEVIMNPHNQVTRNYSQSAHGGNDLVNTFGLSIEVKRQEALNVNTWWKQTVRAAKVAGHDPVLMYRKNNDRWHVMMMVDLPMTIGKKVRAEILVSDFLEWFKWRVRVHMKVGA